MTTETLNKLLERGKGSSTEDEDDDRDNELQFTGSGRVIRC